MNKRRQDGSGSAGKKQKSNCELRMLIHHKAAGGIIGKGGENINKFRDTDDVEDISLPDRNSPERIIIVSAKTQEALVACLKKMMDKLDEINKKLMAGRPSRKEGDSEVRILVHSNQAGAVIGRGGYKIKEIKDETNAEMKVYGEKCPNSSERVIAVTGKQDEVVNGVAAILKVCGETAPAERGLQEYDAGNALPGFAEMYGGYVDPTFRARPDAIGGYGGGGGMMGMRGDAGMMMGMGGMGGGGGRGGGGMMGAGGMGDPMGFNDGYIEGMGYGAPPMGTHSASQKGMGGGGAAALFGRGGGPMGMAGGQFKTTQVTIPDELASAIIGKGGSNIWRIRNESGAEVEIDKESRSGERVICIGGNPNQIQLAQFLLQQAVRGNPQGRRYLDRMGIA